MQALVSGTAASGASVAVLRIVTKAALPHTPEGLRHSAGGATCHMSVTWLLQDYGSCLLAIFWDGIVSTSSPMTLCTHIRVDDSIRKAS
jgi:hypothetical protein